VFNNVPTGLRLFVSVCSKTGLSAKLVEIESSLSLDTTPKIIGDLEARELHIEQGSARAVWEVATPDWPSGVHPIDFVVFAAYEADPLNHSTLFPGLDGFAQSLRRRVPLLVRLKELERSGARSELNIGMDILERR
jgi:hypothetical protein